MTSSAEDSSHMMMIRKASSGFSRILQSEAEEHTNSMMMTPMESPDSSRSLHQLVISLDEVYPESLHCGEEASFCDNPLMYTSSPSVSGVLVEDSPKSKYSKRMRAKLSSTGSNSQLTAGTIRRRTTLVLAYRKVKKAFGFVDE